MFTSTAHAAGSDSLPMPDHVDPAVFHYLFGGIGAVVALFVIYKVARRLLRK